MKLIALFLSAFLSAGSLFAQHHAEAQAPASGMTGEWSPPGGLLHTDDSGAGKPTYINDICMAAVRDFVKRFGAAADPLWIRVPNGGYMARFKKEAVSWRVAYTARGSWVYTLTSYPEKLMRPDIRHLVKSEYYDYSITGVFEAMQYNVEGPVYFV
ncbi:MAG: hypothetical protein JST39_12740, partial [Bacteroidetes bacterium]|nr:hypothetical protein [Bacteroidota bacterium]